ncbi:ABC transporter permease [Metabacillus sp. FJAT-53654]|uniref:ABC transporter permease subunit n=1 Tax=Metabacillus rhizosphaerae TaxID=3117747 RepID=A0ABZ2MYW2_9BACI
MVVGELIRKEIRQYWVQLLLSILAISFMIPIRVWTQYLEYRNFEEALESNMFTINFEYSDPTFIFIVFVVTLGIVQIGVERNNGTLEFNLAMPFSRASIYISKWMVGFGSILISWFISFGLTGVIIKLAGIPTVNFENYFWFLIGSLLLFYTMTFSAGAITGSPFAQGLVTITVGILPLLFIGLIGVQLEVLTEPDFLFSNEQFLSAYNLTPITYVFFKYDSFPIKEVYPPFIEAVFFFILGLFAFIKHPFERNGSFFVWKWMERPIQVFVILLGILGFSSFGYLSTFDHSMVGYFVGAAAGAFIGFIVSYFVIYKKKNEI